MQSLERCRKAPRPPQAPGRGSARRASAISARSSAPVRAPASAARHPTACRRAAGAARQGAGKAHRLARTSVSMRALSASIVAPSRKFCSTVCATKSRQPSGDSARPLLTIAIGRLPGDLLAAPFDATAARSHQPGNRIQRRGLACAVGAEQRDDAACLHVQRHVGDADQIAVAHFKVLDAQAIHSCRPRAWCGGRGRDRPR